jgi:NADPH:quinone reductase-like Zn-dependent oxidoreductase
VTYGDGLADRVRALAPGGVTAAIDLHGTDTAYAARELGVPDKRITTIAAQIDGITPANGADAAPGTWRRSPARGREPGPGTHRGNLPGRADPRRGRAPAGRHVHGKVVIDL